MECSRDELEAIREIADKVGVSFSGLATGLYWGANPASDDSQIRERASEVIHKQIQCAAILGLDGILVIPGSVGADFIPGSEELPYDLVYQRAHDFVGSAVPAAEDAGVSILIENVWNKFLLSPLEFKTFVESFDTSFVGAYLDVGNVLLTGYPEHWIDILGGLIQRVHFKDYRRAVGSVDGFCDLLSGDVNWKNVIDSLNRAGYSGWVTAEMIPPVPFYKHCPEVLIYNTSRAMDAILSL
jgi:hexulose-6-phosphate isomerase